MNHEKPKTLKQHEIDRALLILTDTIKRISSNLNTYTDDTRDDLFYKMSDARKEVDEIAEEARTLFQDCLKRCLNGDNVDIPTPSVKWERDEYDNIIQTSSYKQRPPCEICGEHRKVEFCHIIPRQIGGSDRETNILYLCATHHSCFDKGVLSKEEWEAINWDGRSEVVKTFVREVFLTRQKEYWDGKRVPADIVYHGYRPLTEWIKNHLKYESTGEWNRKRKSKTMMRSGKSKLG
ncbi:MAG: hypothetical protein COV70_03365 [Parcubacteria group bacterium CG11_big_fil_rev_8_21_14_0_20_39_22]|nr:MAG: hypothetical protein COV70_03365 [Parcubacteria group bacterium CG11_big_fil_rev_8_21_14_0_20_39_22]